MIIAIIKDDFHGRHSTAWSAEWLAACVEGGINHDLIDWRAMDSFDRLLKYDKVLWHFSHYSAGEMAFARSLLFALDVAGCDTFPGFSDSWHFDDKIAQAFLLKACEAPTPRNYTLLSPNAVEDWIRQVGIFPVVAKLRVGSGSNNVILINNSTRLRRYARQMFSRGMNSAPNPFFKVSSNLRSSRNFSDVLRRMRRAPEFLYTLANARALPREKGYVYLQEFIPGACYDIKVVVVGSKLSFIGRHTREDDFRASGGGDLFYDRIIMTPNIIEAAFKVAEAMRSRCVGMDFVVDPRTQELYVVEISYGFSHTALLASGGYYDRSGCWHEIPLNAPREILQIMLAEDSVGR